MAAFRTRGRRHSLHHVAYPFWNSRLTGPLGSEMQSQAVGWRFHPRTTTGIPHPLVLPTHFQGGSENSWWDQPGSHHGSDFSPLTLGNQGNSHSLEPSHL